MKCIRDMKKYVRNMKKYVRNMTKYEEISYIGRHSIRAEALTIKGCGRKGF